MGQNADAAILVLQARQQVSSCARQTRCDGADGYDERLGDCPVRDASQAREDHDLAMMTRQIVDRAEDRGNAQLPQDDCLGT